MIKWLPPQRILCANDEFRWRIAATGIEAQHWNEILRREVFQGASRDMNDPGYCELTFWERDVNNAYGGIAALWRAVCEGILDSDMRIPLRTTKYSFIAVWGAALEAAPKHLTLLDDADEDAGNAAAGWAA